MESLFKHAAIAWNPIGETRRRLQAGSLSFGRIAIPFLAVVISCNLFAAGAQSFFFESIEFQLGTQFPNYPLVTNDFSTRLLSSMGALVPAAAVAVLPSGVFSPVGRRAVVASIVILVAAWAFYGALFSIPTYFISGTIVTANFDIGMTVFRFLTLVAIIVISGLMIWFWFKVMRGVLKLTFGKITLITGCAVGSLLATVALIIVAVDASSV